MISASCVCFFLGPTGFVSASEADSDELESLGQAESKKGTLVVHVRDLASDAGNLRFVLFNSKKDFLKRPIRAEVVELDGRQGTWTVPDLSHGLYAVLVHQDVNANGKMERHWYGKPKEPTGASNDAPARFGPPKFKHAQFTFNAPLLELTITVN